MENFLTLFPAHIATRQAELERALAAEEFDQLLIYAGHPAVAFQDDYHYPYKPNPQFTAWVPESAAPHSWLQCRPGTRPQLHFYQPADYWHSVPEEPESWWAQSFDIRVLREVPALADFGLSGRVAVIGEHLEGQLPAQAVLNPQRLVNRLHLDRTVKTAYEQEALAASNRRAVWGHRAAEAAFLNGESEYSIHLAYLEATGHTDAELPYGNIIALNENGATLHYQRLEADPPEEQRSFLIDAGASIAGYAADITRTYTRAAGDFAAMIDTMDTLQQTLANGAVAGVDYRELHLEAHRMIGDCLHEADVISVPGEDALDLGLTSTFYPHGLGHYLGLQVHDVAGLIADAEGTPIDRPNGHPYLRLTRTLAPGNALTIEPGVYFIDLLLDELKQSDNARLVNWEVVQKFRPFGGIRIEDNVIVGENGNRNLTREAFALQD